MKLRGRRGFKIGGLTKWDEEEKVVASRRDHHLWLSFPSRVISFAWLKNGLDDWKIEEKG